MRTSAPGNSRPARRHPGRRRTSAGERGFTLVEIMVVVAVMGLLAAAAVLTIPDPRGRVVDEAERFAARAVAARDAAILESRATAVRVTAAGYAFDREGDGEWLPMQEPPFRATAWGRGVQADVGAGGVARVSFDATGSVSGPASFALVRDGQRVGVAIGADGRVRVGG